MRMTILVVDDEREVRLFLARGFRQAGFKVHTASNGANGLEKARRFAPDLVILDLMLPDIDGYSVCEALRHDPDTAAIPVLMLTGLAGEMPRYAGVEAGANGFLHKPFVWTELLDCARRTLSKSPPNTVASTRAR
jgi:DNA-binding response OmpR family regulator